MYDRASRRPRARLTGKRCEADLHWDAGALARDPVGGYDLVVDGSAAAVPTVQLQQVTGGMTTWDSSWRETIRANPLAKAGRMPDLAEAVRIENG